MQPIEVALRQNHRESMYISDTAMQVKEEGPKRAGPRGGGGGGGDLEGLVHSTASVFISAAINLPEQFLQGGIPF